MATQSSVLLDYIRETSLQRPLPLGDRYQILSACWDLEQTQTQFRDASSRYDAYFRQYEAQCEQCPFTGRGELTHHDILFAIQELKTKKKEDCLKSLAARLSALIDSGHDRIVEDCIKFAGESLFLLDLLAWKEPEFLKEFVHRQLMQPSMQKDNLRLPRSFNAWTLAQVAGFRVRWTSELGKHLIMSDNDEEIAVFHHATILDLAEDSKL
jgi:hypothetical protein